MGHVFEPIIVRGKTCDQYNSRIADQKSSTKRLLLFPFRRDLESARNTIRKHPLGIYPSPQLLQLLHARLPIARDRILPEGRIVEVEIRIIGVEGAGSFFKGRYERGRRSVHTLVIGLVSPDLR